MNWNSATIDELSSRELHAILKLRVDVFVVEQACCYADLDLLDVRSDTLHLAASQGERPLSAGAIACGRLLAPGQAGEASRIGRVAVRRDHRRRGLARELLVRLLALSAERYPQQAIELSAQTTVLALYQSMGFDIRSAPYLEDGIEHVDMRYQPGSP